MRYFSVTLLSASFFLLLAIKSPLHCQEQTRIAFYNVENLFDTIDDPHKNDNDFLSTSAKKWTNRKYWNKQRQIAKVILAMGNPEPPALIALAEIENFLTLFHLANNTILKSFNYKIVHYDSPDRRGIDVALLYRPDKFKLLHKQVNTVYYPQSKSFSTRDILYIKGCLVNDDTIHFFVNHWPSRYGGELKSRPKRWAAANTLKQIVDSVYSTNTSAQMIISGDFNDEPTDSSLSILKSAQCSLINLMEDKKLSKTGTLVYRNKIGNRWYLFDQFLVSKNISESNKNTRLIEANIFKKEFLLEKGRNGFQKPYRTYRGPIYLGGFSDHLPIYLDLKTSD